MKCNSTVIMFFQMPHRPTFWHQTHMQCCRATTRAKHCHIPKIIPFPRYIDAVWVQTVWQFLNHDGSFWNRLPEQPPLERSQKVPEPLHTPTSTSLNSGLSSSGITLPLPTFLTKLGQGSCSRSEQSRAWLKLIV